MVEAQVQLMLAQINRPSIMPGTMLAQAEAATPRKTSCAPSNNTIATQIMGASQRTTAAGLPLCSKFLPAHWKTAELQNGNTTLYHQRCVKTLIDNSKDHRQLKRNELLQQDIRRSGLNKGNMIPPVTFVIRPPPHGDPRNDACVRASP